MRKREPEFDLEHSIMEERSKQFEVLELPLSRRVFLTLFGVAVIFSSLAAVRIYLLAFAEGNFYQNRASANTEKPITLPAKRGSIYDRFGNLLAQNQAAYRLVLNPGLVKRKNIDLDKTLDSLSSILGAEKSEFAGIIEKANLEKTALITLARNLSAGEISAIQKLDNPALEIHSDYTRDYLRGPAFSHILGYTGLAKFNDIIGKTGLEKYYDDALGGTDGLRLMYRDAKGNILEEKLLDAPKNGDNLYTTIDSGLQEYFYNRMDSALKSLGRNVGVGIAMNPQTGEILSLVNLPSYDNNIFTKNEGRAKRSAVLNSSFQPLFDRAVSGAYSPGSTVKPMVAIAGLKEGVITPETKIFSPGFIDVLNPYNPDKPTRFLDWRPQGWVDVRSALARSSNVYFYGVGAGLPAGSEVIGGLKKGGLGIDKLKEYWAKFGFGEKTGIDLDAENVGFLPDPAEKEARKKDIWRIGDTYNVSIGQGDLLATPIQLISQISAIANNGKWEKPFIVKSVKDSENKNILRETNPEIVRDFSEFSSEIKEVQEGMKDAVRKTYGTAHLLADLEFEAAGKTGSSQISNNTKTNAFFVGYAPTSQGEDRGQRTEDGETDGPKIAILILIENAREGSLNAVPVAKDVLDWYYWNRLVITRQ